MTDTAELRRLEAEATPGPWKLAGKATVNSPTGGGIASVTMSNRASNAALIVAMSNALPELLAKAEAHDVLVVENERYATFIRDNLWMIERMEAHGDVCDAAVDEARALAKLGGVDDG